MAKMYELANGHSTQIEKDNSVQHCTVSIHLSIIIEGSCANYSSRVVVVVAFEVENKGSDFYFFFLSYSAGNLVIKETNGKDESKESVD